MIYILLILVIACLVVLFIRQQKLIKNQLKVTELNNGHIILSYKGKDIYNGKPTEV